MPIVKFQVNNESAIRFYKNFGFDIVETKEQYYKRIDPADAFVLEKKIKKENGVSESQSDISPRNFNRAYKIKYLIEFFVLFCFCEASLSIILKSLFNRFNKIQKSVETISLIVFTDSHFNHSLQKMYSEMSNLQKHLTLSTT